MEEFVKLLSENGVEIIIVALFLWDWWTNKKKIVDALIEMKIANGNTSKSLELLQKSMETHTIELKQINEKLDKIYDILIKG